MSSYSDSELKVDIKSKTKKPLHVCLKAKQRYDTSTIRSLKSILNEMHIPDIYERRLLNAVTVNNTELVQELLQANITPNSIDRQQRSALHIAASRGYLEICRLLLQHGADVNSQDIIGNTPLHLAVCSSNFLIITLLLNAGANVGSMDMHGRNPLQLAESKLHILRHSWKSRTIESIQLRDQLQQIVDVMISLWKQKYKLASETDNIDDLEMIKVSINLGHDEEVDDQMARLLEELRDFKLN